MPDEAVMEAIALLRQRRAELIEEAQRLDSVIRVLEETALTVTPAPTSASPPAVASVEQPSVRTLVLRLMEAESRDWSASEIIETAERGGTPIPGKDAENNVRAALASAQKRALIFRTAYGRYKATKWKTAMEAMPLASMNSSMEEVDTET